MSSVVPKQNVSIATVNKMKFSYRLIRDFKKNRYIYLMVLPIVLYYLIFYYGPLYGLQIAFKNYSPGLGMLKSPWIGFKYFHDFFHGFYFWRLLRNTLLLSFYDLILGFGAPIILALLLNEIRNTIFKRTVQTVIYLPYFISIVVVVGMLFDFLARDGLINNILAFFGNERLAYFSESGWFRAIFIGSGIWQNVGWGTVIYMAAIANIDPSLYEAAKVDGANRLHQSIHITLTGMIPTIIILFILQIGNVMSVNSDKVLLMYNTATYDTADVIGTYIYRKGLLEANFSYSAAIGLFNSVINFSLLILANFFSKKITETKLW